MPNQPLQINQIKDFNNILNSFRINASCTNFQLIDNYFYYDLKLNPNAKVNDVKKYSDEISLALKSPCKPSIRVLHQQGLVRLEFAGIRNKSLQLFDYFTNSSVPNNEINCLLGQAVDGKPMWMDLAANPHMLVAGTTGSGKSVLLHNIIGNLFNYNDVDLFLVDPKQIEFSEYKKCRNVQVYYSYQQSMWLMKDIFALMEFRYDLIRQGKEVKSFKPCVIVIDEFADLMMQDVNNNFHDLTCRLAQKCRAARIHIILATQRPSVNFISGSIKANFPARIACRVASHIDSKVILDSVGAENLLGKGDALIKDNFRFLERLQIAHTTPQEVVKYFGNDAE
jgi:S-DNA-T family DNA segregation ATPase FtsK/SpoIIIE